MQLNCGAINVAPEYFHQICMGKKTVEGRLAKEKFCAIQPDSLLEFVADENRVLTRVIEVKKFPTFKKMLEHYGVKECLPELDDIDSGVAIYHSFPGYQKDELLLGVVGIKIELVVKDLENARINRE